MNKLLIPAITIFLLLSIATAYNYNEGWNLAASPYDTPVSIKQGINSLEGCFSYLFTFYNWTWQSYNPAKTGNTMTEISPYYGYWLKVNCTQALWTAITLPENCTNTFDDDLDSNIDCDDLDCIADPSCPGANGQPCLSDSECKSGFCRDGYCCNADCPGACSYCNISGIEGTCTFAPQPEFCNGLDDDCDTVIDNIPLNETPLCENQKGVCQGSIKTCGGASGWLECNYSAIPEYSEADNPEDSYTDANCDGIDGNIENSIFVSSSGNDSNICSIMQPCKTINNAISAAVVQAKTDILIQSGAYSEVINVNGAHNGLAIYGGYDANWSRGAHTSTQYDTDIVGGYYLPDEQYMTIRSRDAQLSFENLELIGPTVSGQVGGYGRSSYIVHSTGSDLTFHHITFSSTNGAPGLAGSNGADASPSIAPGGLSGENNEQYSTSCGIDNGAAGGAAGTNPSCTSANAGSGGQGGDMDTCCTAGTCVLCDCDATVGLSGLNAATYSASYGKGGSAGSTCTSGLDAQNGFAGADGNGGAGGSGYFVSSDMWYSAAGLDGVLGTHGTGGGGGGGGGGCDTGTDATGAGGGGGGAGGCRAPVAGKGGKGGGGSFGVFALSSTIQITNSDFYRGVGGNGGNGGNGGASQQGGLGGSGGLGPGSGHGGDGGNGARGGHSGGGGGGSGGFSYGIYTSGSTVTQSGNSFNGGVGGTGGSGGNSPGYSGSAGASGMLGTAGTFT